VQINETAQGTFPTSTFSPRVSNTRAPRSPIGQTARDIFGNRIKI